MDHESFARPLVRSPDVRAQISELLRTFEAEATPWSQLPGMLGREIDRFERHQIATGFARFHGGKLSVIERRQDFLVRTAVTSILFPLEAFEDRLLNLIENRGIAALPHHIVREFADAGAEVQDLFEASGACRIAAFGIEDLLRDLPANPITPAALVSKRNEMMEQAWARLHPEHVPFGWSGIALLWVASMIGLGGMTDTATTEQFSDY